MSKEFSKSKWNKSASHKKISQKSDDYDVVHESERSVSNTSSDEDDEMTMEIMQRRYRRLMEKYVAVRSENEEFRLFRGEPAMMRVKSQRERVWSDPMKRRESWESSATPEVPKRAVESPKVERVWSDTPKRKNLSSRKREPPKSNPLPHKTKSLLRSYPSVNNRGEMYLIERGHFFYDDDLFEPEYSDSSEFSDDFDINDIDPRGLTPLIEAIELGNYDLFEEILANKECNVNQPDEFGRHPLMCALQNENMEMVKTLLECNANVNCVDEYGNTILHRCLLKDSLKPLAYDLLFNYPVDVLLQNNLQNNPLMISLHEKDAPLTRLLLQRGADPNVKCDNTFPIHIATFLGSLELVTLLIEFGADINVTDGGGNSALHISSKNNYIDILEELLKAKADTRIINNMNYKAFDMTSNERIRKLIEDFDPSTKSWKWEFDATQLAIDPTQKLGQGNYGSVYKGRLFSTPVAVKSLKDLSEKAQDAFNNEVGLMVDIMHPNILILMGTCYSKEWGRCIVTEFIDGGSLSSLIQRNHPLPMHILFNCAIDTARGIAWLHSRNPTILHRDLHTNNILVTKTGVCKVCDFGLSQVEGSFREINRIYKRIRPPEIESGNKIYTQASDVFMLGLILFELLTRQKGTLSNTTSQSLDILLEKNEHNNSLDPALNDEVYRTVVSTYINIVRITVEREQHKRPGIHELVILLESLLDEITPNINNVSTERYGFLGDSSLVNFDSINRRNEFNVNQTIGFEVEDCYYLDDSS